MQMPEDKKLPASGSLFIGEGGTLILPHVGMPTAYPSEKFQLPLEVVKGANHYHVWVDAVLANERTSDGFHYAGPLAETVALGNIATRLPGKKLAWDAAGMKFPATPEAGSLLTKTYRQGFEPII